MFFPIGTTGPALDRIARAEAVCAGCDVRAQCLEWALEHRQDDGVWGGTSEDERRTPPPPPAAGPMSGAAWQRELIARTAGEVQRRRAHP